MLCGDTHNCSLGFVPLFMKCSFCLPFVGSYKFSRPVRGGHLHMWCNAVLVRIFTKEIPAELWSECIQVQLHVKVNLLIS